jgi:acetylornithine deacetylase
MYNMPPLQEILNRLVAIPTVSSIDPAFDQGNLALIELLEGWLQPAGFDCQRIALDAPNPKANLIATVGSGDSGLVLAGHTDTVPCDPDLWSSSPWTLEQREDRFYGLGTTDMKGFLAVAIQVANRYRAQRLKHPLTLVFTADEESTMLGAQRLVELGYPKARYALIGEPTGMRPVYMHKGVGMLALEIEGRSGHSSDPDAGLNALDGMRDALNTLTRWRTELAGRHHNSAFSVPCPTLNLGRINGGDNANRICGACELHFDLRTLPGMVWDDLRVELQQLLAQTLDGSGLKWRLRPLDVVIPAYEIAPDSDWVRTLEDFTASPAEAVAFGSEAPFLQQLGMQVIVCGPGEVALAHKPDEYVTLTALERSEQLLNRLIEKVCLGR